MHIMVQRYHRCMILTQHLMKVDYLWEIYYFEVILHFIQVYELFVICIDVCTYPLKFQELML